MAAFFMTLGKNFLIQMLAATVIGLILRLTTAVFVSFTWAHLARELVMDWAWPAMPGWAQYGMYFGGVDIMFNLMVGAITTRMFLRLISRR